MGPGLRLCIALEQLYSTPYTVDRQVQYATWYSYEWNHILHSFTFAYWILCHVCRLTIISRQYLYRCEGKLSLLHNVVHLEVLVELQEGLSSESSKCPALVTTGHPDHLALAPCERPKAVLLCSWTCNTRGLSRIPYRCRSLAIVKTRLKMFIHKGL